MKRIVYWLIAVGIIMSAGVILSYPSTSTSLSDSYCAFCDKKVLERQKFYEDETVIALYTHKPILPGHCLIIPKKHRLQFDTLSEKEMLEIGKTIQKVHTAVQKVFGTSSYFLLQKNGREVGQTVPHVHFHYVPTKASESASLWIIFRMYWVNLWPPLSKEEIEPVAQQLREAIRS